MKKSIIALMLATSFSFIATSCGNGSGTQVTTKYNVTFNVDGKVISTLEVNKGETVTKPNDPVKEGYEFLGWYKDANLSESSKFDFATTVDENITLYAGFKKVEAPKKVFTVTFELNGGETTGETTQEVTEGELVVKPVNPTKNGYNFSYWASDKDLTKEFNFETTIINSDITLFAKYELIEVTTLYNISASSESDITTRAEFAADGNDNTYWKAKDLSKQELTIDLGMVKEVTNVSQEFADLNGWKFEIRGSIDGTNYASLLENNTGDIGSKYETNVRGYYRYVKLIVPESEIIATSKEFKVDYKDLNEGTNIALGMKGVADCWAPQNTVEMAFDGNKDNYHCCGGPHEGHNFGFESTTADYFVTSVSVYFPNVTDHKFYCEYRNLDGEWVALESGNFKENAERNDIFTFEVNTTLDGLKIYYNSNSDGHWPACKELEINGFRLDKETTIDNMTNIIDLGSLSYLNRIKVPEIDEKATFEVSEDGKKYKEAKATIENGFYVLNKETRYIKVNSETLSAENLQTYTTDYLRNVALLTKPVASTRSDDSGYWENMMTMNKDCQDANGRFWCAKDWNTAETVTLDLGSKVLAKDIVYKYQDYKAENIYKLIIEVSKDNETFEKVLDTTANEAGAQSGQEFKAIFEDYKEFRYLKIQTHALENFTNCNTLAIHGIGSQKI